MTLDFYVMAEDPRKLVKTLGTAAGSFTGVAHADKNDMRLSVKLPSAAYNTVVACNYVFVDLFGKYYFRESYTVQNDCVTVELREDVRMNFATQIRTLKCTVARNEFVRNGYLRDAGYQILAYDKCVARSFPNEINNDCIILMTVG